MRLTVLIVLAASIAASPAAAQTGADDEEVLRRGHGRSESPDRIDATEQILPRGHGLFDAPGAEWEAPPMAVTPRDAVLAEVEGRTITADAFEKRFMEYLVRTGVPDRAFLRWDVLETMVDERLIIHDSYESGIAETDAYRMQRKLTRDKLRIEAYLADVVHGAVEVTEADLEEAFVRMNTELEARHLYARTLEEAEALHARLRNGEAFEDLAREVFFDSTLANGAGSIGRFTFDETDPDFEDAAFALDVGEISPPVRTRQGYSIIQVTDRFTQPILTKLEFASRRQMLSTLVRRNKVFQARSRLAREMADELSPRFHEDALGRLLGMVAGAAPIADAETLDDFFGELLVTFGPADARVTWTVGEFRRWGAETDPAQRAQVRTRADLRDFITGLAIRSELLRRAEAADVESRPDFAEAFEEAMDDWVLKWRKNDVARSVHVPEDSIRAQYERDPYEFATSDGEPVPYVRARPLIEEQLRYLYARRDTEVLIARLRGRYAHMSDDWKVFRVNVAGSHDRVMED